MLIALTGADSIGKSTVSKLLAGEADNHGRMMQVLDRWDICNNPEYPQGRFIRIPLPELKQCVAEMRGPSRLIFILWTVYSVIESYDPESPTITLIDSYWMKHAAAEIAYGLPEEFVLGLVSMLPKPDLTILMDLPPEMAFQRKEKSGFSDLNYYECGMDKTLSRDSFISHQSKIRAQLAHWSQQNGWHRIDASGQPHEVADAISKLALNYFSMSRKN